MYIPGQETVGFIKELHLDPEYGVPSAFSCGGPLGNQADINRDMGPEYVRNFRLHTTLGVGSVATGMAAMITGIQQEYGATVGLGAVTLIGYESACHFGRKMIAAKRVAFERLGITPNRWG